MKYKTTVLKGFSATVIAKRASVSKASVYNWCDGRARLAGKLIEIAIEELEKEKEHENNRRRQESQLKRSIQHTA